MTAYTNATGEDYVMADPLLYLVTEKVLTAAIWGLDTAPSDAGRIARQILVQIPTLSVDRLATALDAAELGGEWNVAGYASVSDAAAALLDELLKL